MTTVSTQSEKPKKAAKRTAQAKKTTTKPKTRKITSEAAAITEDQRQQMIRDAAYFRALSRGFVGGSPEQDWIEAETEISALFEETA